MKKALLNRIHGGEKQTLGAMICLNEFNAPQHSFLTLELPWKNNAPQVSCIPADTYILTLVDSPRFGKAGFFHVTKKDGTEPEGRASIGMHRGNFFFDIRGCILPGNAHTDANADGLLDVVQSTAAFNTIKAWMGGKVGGQFMLTITAPPAPVAV